MYFIILHKKKKKKKKNQKEGKKESLVAVTAHCTYWALQLLSTGPLCPNTSTHLRSQARDHLMQ